MSTLRERLVSKGAPRSKTITVGDEPVEVKSLSAGERGRILSECLIMPGKDDEEGEAKTDLSKLGPMLVIATAHDPETHAAIFSEADFELVSRLDAGYLDPIVTTASELAGISASAAKVAEGNSGGTTVAGSGSASPES